MPLFRPAGCKIRAQDGGKVILARPLDDPMLVVEAFHRARLRAFRAEAAIVAPHAAFRTDFRAIFGEVQHGRSVEIGADP